jgi:hypothetical protein
MSILDAYTDAYPTVDNALDIFKGEWSSHLPGFEKSGTAALFEDPRLLSIIDKCGGLSGKKCLELGPLEGGHTS